MDKITPLFVEIYCYKCDQNHNITAERAARLIAQYQYRIMVTAHDQPLPRNILTTPEKIMRSFCVKDDDKPSRRTTSMSAWVHYVSACRAALKRKQARRAPTFLPRTLPNDRSA